jgi:hypothetical protein
MALFYPRPGERSTLRPGRRNYQQTLQFPALRQTAVFTQLADNFSDNVNGRTIAIRVPSYHS